LFKVEYREFYLFGRKAGSSSYNTGKETESRETVYKEMRLANIWLCSTPTQNSVHYTLQIFSMAINKLKNR